MTKIQYSGYDIAARGRGQQPIFYEQFGSYQGEWLLASRDDTNYYIYKDYYGSCSGCDSMEAADLPNEFELGDPTVEAFIKDYPPFAVIPHEAMISMVKSGTLITALPLNVGYDLNQTTIDTVVEQISLMIKSYEGFIAAQEIVKIANIERRREAIDRFGGEEKFMDELGGEVRDTDGDNRLLVVTHEPEDFVFVNVKDSSTSRRYMLRVPPSTQTVKEGIAWTFDLKPEEYILEQEA